MTEGQEHEWEYCLPIPEAANELSERSVGTLCCSPTCTSAVQASISIQGGAAEERLVNFNSQCVLQAREHLAAAVLPTLIRQKALHLSPLTSSDRPSSHSLPSK